MQAPGTYSHHGDQPADFRAYLDGQLEPLVADYGVELEVGLSAQEIPYPYVLEPGADARRRAGRRAAELATYFPMPLLSLVGDEIADGTCGSRWPTSRGRSRCSTPCGSISRCAAWCTTPAATGAMCSPGSC